MLLVTADGEKFDPSKRSYQLADMCRLANVSRRQVDEWVREQIIVAPINPGQGKKRDFSFENLFDCFLAKAFSYSGQVRLLRDAIRVDAPRTPILQKVLENFPTELKEDELISIMKTLPPTFVAVHFVSAHTGLIEEASPIAVTSRMYVGKEKPTPNSIMPEASENAVMRKMTLSGFLPPMVITVNATQLFCQLAYRLISDQG